MSTKEVKQPTDATDYAVGSIVAFGITAFALWHQDYGTHYAFPLWIGIALATGLLIAVGYGVSKIWREPGRGGFKVTGLIYLSSVVIMTFGRIFTL
jgi:hypothetical protein